MKYVGFEVNTGEQNMQIDNDLLDFAIKTQASEPVLRLYGWSPACVSLGRNQSDEFLDKDFLKSKNIDIVRRLTGGRAILHDEELTYSYICPVSSLKNGESVVNSYKEISQFLVDGFAKLGIKLEFSSNKKTHKKITNEKTDYCMSISTGADLSFEGKKLIGSAQFRKEGYILQHGSILFNYDKKLIEKLFSEIIDKNALTCLNYINPAIGYDETKSVLYDSFINHCQ